jgi:preprotein translocase subunit SecA
MSSLNLSPTIAQGFYPEKKSLFESKLDRAVISAIGNATSWVRARTGRFHTIVKRVNEFGAALQGLSEGKLREQVAKLRSSLKTDGMTFDLAAQTFAVVREFADLKLDMRHFDVQLIGGWVLLNGMVAEMETGEGKTLTATLPACTAALTGIPVHIVTVNDYLAKRDAEWMRPVYESLGLSVGVIIQGMEFEERCHAYRCDITYCTNKELTFDYLRDRLVLGQKPGQIQMRVERLYKSDARLNQLRLRGLSFAIVDEADSVLIDEARTPLIISGKGGNDFEIQVYLQALELSDELNPEDGYAVDYAKKTVELTEDGKAHIHQLAKPLGGFWNGKLMREELVQQALTARHLFSRDKDYLVKDGKIQIIDEYTGRLMSDRSWERGLHQLVEAKEGCEITAQNETLTRISYQRFFRRYLYLAGMTGTAREVARELWSVYRLSVVPIPTHKPLMRIACKSRVYGKAQEKWSDVIKRIAELHEQGRPVLVGTRSVATSEHVGEQLTEEGIPHRILNARQNLEEAEIIAQAGQKGQVTVATNMAGRGTDISILQEVKELGGLHVIATERHDARRIDRQLFGRCGRLGDPGSFESMASLEDELLENLMNTHLGRLLYRWVNPDTWFGSLMGNLIAAYAQYAAQRRHFLVRRDLLKFDEYLETAIAFSGHGE